MANLGELEQAIMDVLWDSGEPLPAPEVRERLATQPVVAGSAGGGVAVKKDLAITTVLTVLSRLEKKGLVRRNRAIRPHLYRASYTRADYTAQIVDDVLGVGERREAALARFIGQVTPEEASELRRLLEDAPTISQA